MAELEDLNLLWSAADLCEEAEVSKAICELAPNMRMGRSLWEGTAHSSTWNKIWTGVQEGLAGPFRLGPAVSGIFKE